MEGKMEKKLSSYIPWKMDITDQMMEKKCTEGTES
jgi:hypothetical protein